ncbi:MAG: ACP S-malonyltransferase [Deltaproteobacteria bacterium]|nr:ACP S-malonyltransferase [Deltaproteobacteria bacterium]
MKRIAFLFPGQGAQEVGMGRELLGRDPFTDELFARACSESGVDVSGACLKGPAKVLAETRVLQPAVTAFSLSLLARLEDAGVRPDVVAGHSLGEIPALSAAGMCDPLDAVSLAVERGRLMSEAAAGRDGAMIAVTGLTVALVFDAVESMRGAGAISAGAVNAPTQVTVSGDRAMVDKAAELLGKRPGAKVVRLNVSGAWHSEHMRSCVEPFGQALAQTPLVPARVPVVLNRDGGEAIEPDEVRSALFGQLVSPVRFDLVMERLVGMEVTDFVEIGPGKVLRGLVRLNHPDPSVSVWNVSDLRSLERAAEALA